MKHWMAGVLCACVLAGCQESGSDTVPKPIALTEEAAGHFCQMTVLDHPGPKGQVHLHGFAFPLWFSQVRDAIAFDRMPERMGDVAVIYVNDMGAAASWDVPGIENWIDVRSAWFVHGSSRRGGMGAPELVPFAEQQHALDFTGRHGGSVIAYDDITDEMVLAPVEIDAEAAGEGAHGAHGSTPGESG